MLIFETSPIAALMPSSIERYLSLASAPILSFMTFFIQPGICPDLSVPNSALPISSVCKSALSLPLWSRSELPIMPCSMWIFLRSISSPTKLPPSDEP